MTGVDIMVVCGVILATGWVQATAGFGFALLTVPLLLLRLSLEDAVVIATLVGTIGNLGHSLHSRADLDRTLTRRFLLCTILGGPVGAYLLFNVDARWVKLVLGVSVLFGVVALQRGFDGVAQGSWFDWLFGLVSGVLNTATSTNGPPLVFVLQARKVSPAAFRATLNTVFLFSGIYAAVLYALRRVGRHLGARVGRPRGAAGENGTGAGLATGGRPCVVPGPCWRPWRAPSAPA
ncbi:MAG: sulfite exporter TauE/SafE family protein [Actinobacteria bacterium]|nr:sulfite exporter TauE/SafE family protein [Actinomycetota bacterium]